MSKMDIVELRLRRTVALIIDWYITNMLASIPITFFLRKDSQFKPEMFELNAYGFNTALIVCLIAITIGYFIMYSFLFISGKVRLQVRRFVKSKLLIMIIKMSL